MKNTVIHAESLSTLKTMETNSIDTIITDPPYEIAFNKNTWDNTGIAYNVDFWAECLRVLKPGGHLLSFGATRTWHRMAIAIEDAGFEIRDSLAWLYGTGFPKNQDIAKTIDRFDAIDERQKRAWEFTAWARTTGMTSKQIDEATGTNMGNHYLTDKSQPAIPTPDIFAQLRPLLTGVTIPEWVEGYVYERGIESENTKARKVVGSKRLPTGVAFDGVNYGGGARTQYDAEVTAAHTPEAQKWQGWGTAIKPAFEPIVLARKPLEANTTARNVVKWGVGAINVDAARIGDRYPSNVLLDENQAEAVDNFSNLASRFFYVAKPSKAERINVDGVAHPTVKPLTLMRYLTKLATPPGGVILDPFAGSGTTLEAAKLEGFDFIGIEMTADYIPLINARLERAAA